MRKIISIVVMLILATFYTYSQSVDLDRIESDGRRQLMTKTEEFNFDGNDYKIGVKAYVSDYYTDWLLLVSSFHYISKSTMILLKLGNDEVIELPVNNVNVGEVTMPGYGVQIGVITSYSPSSKVNYYSSVYELTEEIISKISTHGIKKMRIYDGVEYHDRKHCKFISHYIVVGINNISKRINKKPQKHGLYDDF